MTLTPIRTDLLPAFRCSGLALHKTLKLVSRATPRAGALPALRWVKVTADDQGVRLLCTDLDLELSWSIPGALVVEHGIAFVPAVLLGDAVRGMTSKAKDRPVTITTTNDGQMTVDTGRIVVSIDLKPADEFPRSSTDEPHGFAFVSPLVLGDVLDAAGTDDSRPVLCHVQITDTCVAATDSYRLHVLDDLTPIGLDRELLVPKQAITETIAVAGDDPVAVSWYDRRVRFECSNGVTVTSRLLDGQFPNWRGLMPSSPPCGVRFDTAEFVEVLAEVARWATAGTPVRIEFDDEVAMSASSQDLGSARAKLDASVVSGIPPVAVGFNEKYLAQLVKGLGEEFTLSICDANKPAVIVERFADLGTRRRLIMPVRI